MRPAGSGAGWRADPDRVPGARFLQGMGKLRPVTRAEQLARRVRATERLVGALKWPWRHRTEPAPQALDSVGHGGGGRGGGETGVRGEWGRSNRPTDWELARRAHRGYRLGCCHFHAPLARALDSALRDGPPPGHSSGFTVASGLGRAVGLQPAGDLEPAPRLPRGGGSPGYLGGGVSEIARSFVGSLAALPTHRLAGVAAVLEVCTFPALLRASLAPFAGAGVRTLRREWEQAKARFARMSREELAWEIVRAMRRRLPAPAGRLRASGGLPAAPGRRGPASAGALGASGGAGPLPHLEAFLATVLGSLAQEYGLAARPYGPELLQDTLVAAAREAERSYGPGRVDPGDRRALGRLVTAGVALGTLGTLGSLGRHRLSLTLATMLYVLTTSLFGVTLPFDAYRWLAIAVELLLQPPVVVASAVGAEGLLYSRCRSRFDLRVLGLALAAIYQVTELARDGTAGSLSGPRALSPSP